MHYPEPIAKLMDSYMKLPGIGAKTAARLAFFSLSLSEEEVVAFANALISVKRDLTRCSVCGNITQSDPCTRIMVFSSRRSVKNMAMVMGLHC